MQVACATVLLKLPKLTTPGKGHYQKQILLPWKPADNAKSSHFYSPKRETRRKKERNRDSSRRGARLKGSENAGVPGRGAASWGMTRAHATHAPSIHTLHQHVQNVCYLPQEAGRKQPEMAETALQCDFHRGSKMWETMQKSQKELPGAYFKATLVVSTEGTEHGIRRHSFEFRLCL